jgi:hypothetical protein
MMAYPTGQPKGWVVVEIESERKVRSSTAIAR